MVRYGYCCINMELSKQGIYTGRTLTKKKFDVEGINLASDIALENAVDLLTILEWNEAHGIRLFRIGSEIFPRWDHYELQDLPDIDLISDILAEAGEYARQHGHRLTTHPGPFHILGSDKPHVIKNSIIGLERHSEMFDLMGFDPSYDNAINIHIGATYGDKDSTVARWLKNYNRLSDRLKSRLVVENDDRESMYSVQDLYTMLHTQINIPITFDYYHHTFNTGNLSEEEAFLLARETWTKHNVRQMCHISQSRRNELLTIIVGLLKKFNVVVENVNNLDELDLTEYPIIHKYYNEFKKVRKQAHSDYIINLPSTYGFNDVDIDVEAKAKELALERMCIYSENNTKILRD